MSANIETVAGLVLKEEKTKFVRVVGEYVKIILQAPVGLVTFAMGLLESYQRDLL